MVYSKHFVAAIKTGSKILRESNNSNNSPTVQLPFGSEFSILMKNMSTQKAVVKISIDGSDVLNGRSIIVNPNSDLELERFLTDSNIGNRFKFIEKTEQISDHRGDRVDDGIVRIEFQFEAVQPPIVYNGLSNWGYQQNHYHWNNNVFRSGFDGIQIGGSLTNGQNALYSSNISDCVGSHDSHGTATINNISSTTVNYSATASGISSKGIMRGMSIGTASATASAAPASTDGITVKGSISEQKFVQGYIGELEPEKHVITLMLKGMMDKKPVVVPVTTKMKSKCEICGTVFRGFPNNCSNCGAAINAAI